MAVACLLTAPWPGSAFFFLSRRCRTWALVTGSGRIVASSDSSSMTAPCQGKGDHSTPPTPLELMNMLRPAFQGPSKRPPSRRCCRPCPQGAGDQGPAAPIPGCRLMPLGPGPIWRPLARAISPGGRHLIRAGAIWDQEAVPGFESEKVRAALGLAALHWLSRARANAGFHAVDGLALR